MEYFLRRFDNPDASDDGPFYIQAQRMRSPRQRYRLLPELQRQIEKDGLQAGDEIPAKTFHEFKDKSLLMPSEAGAARLSASTRAEESEQQEEAGPLTESLFVELLSSKPIETNSNGFQTLHVRSLAPTKRTPVESDIQVRFLEGGLKLAPSQRLRLFLIDSDARRAVCRTPNLHPVSGEVVVDREGKKWRFEDFGGKKHKAQVTLRSMSGDESKSLPYYQLVASDEELRLRSDRDESTGEVCWEVLDVGPAASEQAAPATRDFFNSLEQGNLEQAVSFLRTSLQRGGRLPEPVWQDFLDRRTALARRVADVWRDLRRDHLSASWFHLRDQLTLGQMDEVTSRDWDVSRIHSQFLRHIEIRAKSHPRHSRSLTRYWLSLSEIEPRDFSLSTIDLPQLVELSEPARRGFIPEEHFLEIVGPKIGYHDHEDMFVRRWAFFMEKLPPEKARYKRYPVSKGSGGTRWIDEPCEPLARVQKHISGMLNGYRAAHPSATGFVTGRSPAMHARYHEGAECAVVVDIRDFFSSITREQVREALEFGPHVSPYRYDRWCNPFKNWEPHGRRAIERLVVHPRHNRLPQGAPSSPAIANLVAVPFDIAIEEALHKLPGSTRSWRYSRYADDLIISSTKVRTGQVLAQARQILIDAIHEQGWREAPEKTHTWYSAEGPLYVCGAKVPDKQGSPLGLPRDEKRRLRSALHHIENGRGTDADNGLVAYAYNVTAKHQLRAISSTNTRSLLWDLASGLVAEDNTRPFLDAWMWT